MKAILVFIIFSFLFASVYSQSIEFSKDNFDDQEGLKEALKNIKEGDKLFAKKDLELYPAAVDFYLKAQVFNARNAILNFKIGACYLVLTASTDKSLEFFLIAKNLDKDVDIKIDYAIGQAYQANEDYEMAINSYNIFLNSLEAEDREVVQADVDEKLRICMKALEDEDVTEDIGSTNKESISDEELVENNNSQGKQGNQEIEDEENNAGQGKSGETVSNENTETEASSTSNPENAQKYEIFKVQIATSKTRLSVEKLHAIYNGEYPIEEMFADNEYRYYIGAFTSQEQAATLKENCGVKDAFIVGKSAENDYVAVSSGTNNTQQNNNNQVNNNGNNNNGSDNNSVVDKEGVVFKVQISSNASRQSPTELMKVYSGKLKIEEMQVDGLYKYMLGNEISYYKALEIKKNCEVDGCFIVGFKDEKRIGDIRPYIK